MSAAAAKLKGVSKTYGHGRTAVRALRGVDLELYAGELMLVEGPSGSGKTTLLHILGLLQRPDEGQVWIGDRRMDELPESRLPDERRRNVGFVFQGFNLLDSLTVQDNVAIAGLLTRGSRRATPVGTFLHRLGLHQRAGHLPAELSGGEKQRTSIARALACPGSLILADEPTANLDWENAQEVLTSLTDLAHREGRAVVMVSHDSRLEPFADRIVKLMEGQISDDHRLREKPAGRAGETLAAGQSADRQPRRTGQRAVWLSLSLLLLACGAVGWRYFQGGSWPAGKQDPGLPAANSPSPYVAAAPAVVEPGTRLVILCSERRGRIKAILKRAGERVRRGEPLALIDDASVKAMVEQRQAELKLAEADLTKLRAWDRPEQRARSKAAVARGQARLDRADRELKRIQSLYDDKAAPSTELDYSIEEQRSAAAALDEARQAWTISEAGPTVEEIQVAQAHVEQARAALHLAETELSLLTIVSPLNGHVVYRHLEPGEVVDPESPTPAPILSLGDLDDLRLRAEVDEADIERVWVGQKVVATAEAFGYRELTGRVVHLEPMMGRKSIRTERATEQQDTKVREVLIKLDPGAPVLPVDLQMTVRFLGAPGRSATSPASLPARGR